MPAPKINQIPPNIPWGKIYHKLEKWRKMFSLTNPSVSTIAGHCINKPWAVLVSTIISLRTKDNVTLEASRRLLERAPCPANLLTLKQSVIEGLIYPAGFYRIKSATLKKIAAILISNYQGTVPSTMDALLSLPGVGRKTANLVMIEAFDKPGICVDIHVHRISNRIGWLNTKSPDETETTLREILPRKYWKGLNALLVLYGQNLCRPVSPYCSRCVIDIHCSKTGVARSR
jgi:endonuclease-3